MRMNSILKMRLSTDDRKLIEHKAHSLGIPMSEYARKCCLGRKIPSSMDQQAIRDLVRMNADLARLGNLLKLAMMEFADEQDSRIAKKLVQDAQQYMSEVRQAQALLKQKIYCLDT